MHVSIHAPARGATQMSVVLYGETTVSIHAPARGATIGKYLYPQLVQVSIHAPARGATGVTVSSFTPLLFQFTLPRGERPSSKAL